MKTYSEQVKIMEAAASATKKICIIMRGVPGGGKSTRAKELLRELGGHPQGHIFSTDNLFSPIANKLRFLGHITPETIGLNDAIDLCAKLIDMWYGSGWSEPKKQGAEAFNEFKTLHDQGRYYEALQFAQHMVDTIETVEYRHEWQPGRLKKAHANNLADFKAAIDLGVTPVIVDNTNTVIREAAAYVRYAHAAGYEIRVEEPNSPHWTAHRDLFANKYENRVKLGEFAKFLASKNTHGVPQEVIQKMIDRWHHNMKPKDLIDAKDDS